MNDIMMEEVFREEKPDDGDCVIEDAVSISTNVVEEVDESELSRLRLHSPKETPPPGKKEVEEKPPSEEKPRDNNNEIARRLSLELPSTSKTSATHDHDSATDSDEEDATPTKDNYTVAVTVETKTVEVITEHPSSPSGERKEPLGDSQHSATETKQKEDVEQLSEEEVMVEITPTVQKAFEPSIPPKSIMYADTSSDQDSDDEEEREILPPVQRSQKVMNFDKVMDDSTVNGKLEVVTTVTTKTLDSTSSDDERSSEDDKKPRKQRNLTVTRIVVRDDGKPDELSSGPVKLSLDGREAITDEEFSEKLI
ncbi:hypothetical protein ANCCAN_00529 [Ancylostoma caninum]|uniref:Uncharacterized protein n=1 Tax=Ancylostoma caninum TaxID=29170 RepID=A0A368HA24_ANCCA|nr:hypothetical protein ANCCAN_00529 [Ancylostoma caninum]